VGFNAPAAGKTGTSRDGWFAGYTSNLLCIVWVGFDDNRDLGLAGGAAAAPLWGEFMKRAVALPAYSKTVDFEPPDGVVDVSIDTQSGQLASNACPETQSQTQSEVEYFIEGTEPTQGCQAQGAQTGGSWLSHLFGKGSGPAPPPGGADGNSNATGNARAKSPSASQSPSADDQSSQDNEKKKGLLGRIFGIFGGSKKPADGSEPQK
jgi:penicillin-binding protein 1B